jgi:acyl-CoA thioester hydrolase
MLEVLRSAVNTWECDQMGHMNVKHYFARATQGLGVLGLSLGYGPTRLRAQGLALRPTAQHVRFNRELRPGAPYTLSAGVLAADGGRLRVYEEMRSLTGDEVAATFVSDVALYDLQSGALHAFDDAALQRVASIVTTLPAHAEPRGMTLDAPRAPITRPQAIALGMTGAFLGPVLADDCDASGRALESTFMGRISDGIGHFFHVLRQGLRPDGVGGAALDYRYVYHRRPCRDDLLEVRTGLKALGRKTLHFCNYTFDVETGACVATSEAVAVSFDLVARKAVDISDEARAAMTPRIIAGLAP